MSSSKKTSDVKPKRLQLKREHGHPPLCQRPNGRYLQTLCAWSFRLVLTQLFRERSSALFQSASVQHFLGQNAKQQPYGSSKPRHHTTPEGELSTSSSFAPGTALSLDFLSQTQFPPLTRNVLPPLVSADESESVNNNLEEISEHDNMPEELPGYVQLQHTVVYDCYATMQMMFQCFDLTASLHRPLQRLCHEQQHPQYMRGTPRSYNRTYLEQQHQRERHEMTRPSFPPQPPFRPPNFGLPPLHPPPPHCFLPPGSYASGSYAPQPTYLPRGYQDVPLYTSAIHALQRGHRMSPHMSPTMVAPMRPPMAPTDFQLEQDMCAITPCADAPS